MDDLSLFGLFLLYPSIMGCIVKLDKMVTDYFDLAVDRVSLDLSWVICLSHSQSAVEERVQSKGKGQVSLCIVFV